MCNPLQMEHGRGVADPTLPGEHSHGRARVARPFYIFIAELMPGRTLHVPELALDRVVPLQPTWALVYGSLYLFVIMLPVFVVRQEVQIPPHRSGLSHGVDCCVCLLSG